MGKRCVVVNCNNTTSCASLHTFPTDETVARKWHHFVNITRKWNVSLEQAIKSKTTICSEHFTSDCYPQSQLMQKQMGFQPKMTLLPGSVPCVLPVDELSTTQSTKNPTRKIQRKFPDLTQPPSGDDEKTLTVELSSDQNGSSDDKYNHQDYSRDNKQLGEVLDSNPCSDVILKSKNCEPKRDNQDEVVNNSGFKRKTTFANSSGCEKKRHADVKSETLGDFERHVNVKLEPLQESVDNVIEQCNELICDNSANNVDSYSESRDVKSESHESYSESCDIESESRQSNSESHDKNAESHESTTQSHDVKSPICDSHLSPLSSIINTDNHSRECDSIPVNFGSFDNIVTNHSECESSDEYTEHVNNKKLDMKFRKRCAVYNCRSTNASASIHVFPTDETVARIWHQFVNVTRKWNVSLEQAIKSKRTICSEHFTSDCYAQSQLMRKRMGFQPKLKLLQGSVPCVLPDDLLSTTQSTKKSKKKIRRKKAQLSPEDEEKTSAVGSSSDQNGTGDNTKDSHKRDNEMLGEGPKLKNVEPKLDDQCEVVNNSRVKRKTTFSKNIGCKKKRHAEDKFETFNNYKHHGKVKIEPSQESVDNSTEQRNEAISEAISEYIANIVTSNSETLDINSKSRDNNSETRDESHETYAQTRYSKPSLRDSHSEARDRISDDDNYGRDCESIPVNFESLDNIVPRHLECEASSSDEET